MNAKETAFLKQLMQEAYPLLYRLASLSFRDPLIVEELIQDTFHDAVPQVGKLMRHENPNGWLIAVLKNKISDYKKDLSRRTQRETALSEEELQRLPNSSGIQPGSEAHLLLLSLPEVLSPEDYRLFREFLTGASYIQIAEHNGLTVWNCRKRIQRIRERLRAEFRDEKK